MVEATQQDTDRKFYGSQGTPCFDPGAITDHQIGTSVHAPQRPMVTYIGMGIVVPGPHGLFATEFEF
ncbi:hypothetical protein TNCV_1150481 [Trichonephila clavipes]|nr:hypothetical protein TNCV_1150481 [Trichonephila clavipes]